MSRPQCSVFIAVSVDGFIARPDGAVDWLDSVQRPGEDYGYKEFADSVDTLVFGPSGGGLHTEVEWVDLGSVVATAAVLADTAIHYCGTGR